MKKFLAAGALILTLIMSPCFSQVLQSGEKNFEKLVFNSARPWTAARWYVLGQWIGPNRVKWLGGGQSAFKFPNVTCLDAKNPNGDFERISEPNDSVVDDIEILKSKDFFAIEVPTSQVSEKFYVKTGKILPEGDHSCRIEIELKYSWLQGPGDVRPLIFLSPQKNKYFGYEIHLEPPTEKPDSVADISMDLMFGYTYAKVPNAFDDASKTLHLAPMAKARGEWVPFKEYFGMSLSLEQTMASWGGVADQQGLFSDWSIGSFVEVFLPVFDAVQIRGSANYYEHLADDNVATATFSPLIKVSKYFTVKGLVNLYFADQWFLGGELEYAIPGKMAGVGVSQSMLGITGRLGLRVTSFMFFILEGDMRNYKAEGTQTETTLQSYLGIRLDL
jgi:hypothetical protein